MARAVSRRPEFRVVAVTDSARTVWSGGGLDVAPLAMRKEGQGQLLAGPGEREDPWGPVEALAEVRPDVVVDALPTDLESAQPGLGLLRAAVDFGVHAVLADKGPLAVAAGEVREAFRARGLLLRHGATVGGAVPILETLERLAGADRVLGIAAVVNGSTSFVLDRVESGHRLLDAVEEAQRLGILERNPLLDLAGHDAAAKAAILHQVAFGSALEWRRVAARGIVTVSEEDVRWQFVRGFRTRLVARVTPAAAAVGAVAVDAASPLATRGTGNAFVVRCEDAGTLVLAGPGAGPRETAGTVLRDLLHVRAQAAAASALREPAETLAAVSRSA